MTRGARPFEHLLHAVFFLCAAISVLVTAGIIWVLVSESVGFFRHVSVMEFLTGSVWAPKLAGQFGVLPLVCATVIIAGGALLIAVPVGVATSLFLSEFAPGYVRQVVKPILEILAGIPSVVYGYFALTFITPLIIKRLAPDTGEFNMLAAAIVLGIMVIPTIASLCDDALRAVPNSLRHAAHALGATRVEVATRVVLPAALSGVFAAILLGLARAIGETMAVTLAAGQMPRLTLNPLESAQTMTAYIVQMSMGDVAHGTIEYQSIFAVGLALFAMTFTTNWIAQRVLARYRETYD